MGCGRARAEEQEEEINFLCNHYNVSRAQLEKDKGLLKLLEKMYDDEKELHRRHKRKLDARASAFLKLDDNERAALGL